MPNVSALLLAAGASRRMGTPKQLLPLGGVPVLRHCTGTLLEAGIEQVVVVVPPTPRAVAGCLRDLPVTIVVNRHAGSDMASSVRAGLTALDGSRQGVLVCLSDLPLIDVSTIRVLTAERDRVPGSIIVPTFQGTPGHPTVFPLELLKRMGPERTLRDLKEASSSLVVPLPVEDEGIVIDMDTMDDYKTVLSKAEQLGIVPSAAGKAPRRVSLRNQPCTGGYYGR